VSPERWQRIKNVFGEARIREGAEREAFLEEACGADYGLRTEVDSLLRENGSGLESPIQATDWTGRDLGPFHVVEKIGAGGMGAVWKATDSKLGRTVALKFVAAHNLSGETQQRLLREAQASAALDHPSICHVYGIHEELGQTFIAMAYVDGPALAEKIKERPLPLDEALDIAIQIAEGLQEAHEKGVVHRDIKPHNVMLTAKGQVKITDFGLASLADRSKLTKTGTTLGTPAYMAPEQLEGGEVDRRADLWALGCVLYEMLTQKTPFDAEYEQAVAYGILNEEPEPVSAQRAGLPLDVDRVISKALSKNCQLRYQHADDFLVDLRGLRGSQKSGPVPLSAGAAHASTSRPLSATLPWFLAICACLGVAYLALRPPVKQVGVRKFTLATPLGAESSPSVLFSGAKISPTGDSIVYTTEAGIAVRHLTELDARLLEGTGGAIRPLFSPDGSMIAYGSDGELRKLSSSGGTSTLVCKWPGRSYFGGAWKPDGSEIIFSSGVAPALYRVAAGGGQPELLFSPDELRSMAAEATALRSGRGRTTPLATRPVFAGESGEVLVFSLGYGGGVRMVAVNLATRQSKILRPGSSHGYAPSGHLIYGSGSGVWALSLSPERLEATGEPFLIAEGAFASSAAQDGTLIYVERELQSSRLVMRDRSGVRQGYVTEALPMLTSPALHSSGKRLVFEAWQEREEWRAPEPDGELWAHDIEKGATRRLRGTANEEFRPVWSPSGEEVLYSSNEPGDFDLFIRRWDSSDEPRLVIGEEAREVSCDWSSDGLFILFRRQELGATGDMWYLQRDSGESEEWRAQPFIESPDADIRLARFSPNGRYVAYESDESGSTDIYVRSFPDGEFQGQISSAGGSVPLWGAGGRELFYVEGDVLMTTQVTTEGEFRFGKPERLFRDPNLRYTRAYPYAPTADSQQFVMPEPVGEPAPARLRLVQNWYEEFRDRH